MCIGYDLASEEYVQRVRRIFNADSSPAVGVRIVQICIHTDVRDHLK